jgi:transcriptional regulator with XRE-family HTH domain
MTVTGKLLRDKREKLELSQKKAAKLMGFSNVFLGRIELGKCDLPVKHVTIAAKVLKITRDEILSSLKFDLSSRIDKKSNR